MKKILLLITLMVSMFTMPSCQKDDNQTVNELTCEVVYTNVTTTSGNDGSITITVKTGNNGYNYSISSPNLTTPISNTSGRFTTLKAGNYIVKVTDSKQKVFTMTVNITEPNQLTCDVTSTNVTTNGGNNGSITIKVKTGNGGYNYTVNTTSNTTGVFTNLVAGVYNVKVTDSKNSTFNSSVTITEPAHTPILTLLPATDITKSSATLNGSFNVYGVVSKVYFQFGLDFDLNDDAVHKTPDQTYNSNGVTTTKFNTLDVYTNQQLNFNPNTKVYYKMVIENSNGTYSSDISFFTTLTMPSYELLGVSNITTTSVTFNSNVNSNGGNTTSVVYQFSTNETTFNQSTQPIIVDGNTYKPVNVILNSGSLVSNTKYYYRMILEKNGETFYSETKSFTTVRIPIEVGHQMFGGTVFEVTGTYPNEHGKVIQNTDYSSTVTWVSKFPSGAIYTDCKVTDGNGIVWRVPSFGEIQLAYNNVNTTVQLNGIYWVGETMSPNQRGYFNPTNPNTLLYYYMDNAHSAKFRLITTF